MPRLASMKRIPDALDAALREIACPVCHKPKRSLAGIAKRFKMSRQAVSYRFRQAMTYYARGK